MIVNQEPISEDQTISLRLELASEGDNKPFLNIQTRNKWCHPILEPSLFNTRFEILELSPEDSSIIQKIIGTFGFRDTEHVT